MAYKMFMRWASPNLSSTDGYEALVISFAMTIKSMVIKGTYFI